MAIRQNWSIAATVVAAFLILTACSSTTRQFKESEYFEIVEYPEYYENSFGEVEDVSVRWALQLKEAYQPFMKEWAPGPLPAPDEEYSYVAFTFEADCSLVEFAFDSQNGQYSYGKTIPDEAPEEAESTVEWKECR